MPLIKDEQEVKKSSQFLKYEAGDAGNILILKSHLYRIDSHFLKGVNRSVECRAEECLYCQAGYQKRSEYNYMVFLNGQVGFLDIKGSVFFAIQSIAKAQKRDPRQISWTVIKKGEGLNTDYTTSKDDNLGEEDYKSALEEIDANTSKLVEVMERHEADLSSNYAQYVGEIRAQEKPKVKTELGMLREKPEPVKLKQVVVKEEEPEAPIDVNQIPF